MARSLIVVDLRENEMARRADLHLRATPSTDIVWLSAVAGINPLVFLSPRHTDYLQPGYCTGSYAGAGDLFCTRSHADARLRACPNRTARIRTYNIGRM
jgi:hypothetical protein